MHYLDELNPAQKEAVLTTQGPVSVLAGAGSGKTKVLTSRIYHLIREGVSPEQILAVTFTNKASREMRERLRHKLGTEGPLPFVSTFHGLGRELLEEHGRVLDVPRYFTIWDRDDSERAIKAALKTLDVDPKEVPPRSILAQISKAKSAGLSRGDYKQQHAHKSFRNRITSEAWGHYESLIKKEKSLDFDDLIMLPVKLLREHDAIRARVQERFHYIHIDEFQDTNELQGELASLLAGTRQNLFVVGDIDQTIYTWRGATIDNLLSFEKAYPNAKTIVLGHNYRSTKTIVTASNQIIEKNKNRKEKVATTNNPDGDEIYVIMAQNAEGEARRVAKEIKDELRRGTAPESIAVLFRTNFQSRVLEEAFLHAGIPYKLLGTRFFDRKEVKDVLAWIRLALDPSREVDMVRAVQAPPRGIGKVLLGKIALGKREEFRPAERKKVEAFEETVASLNAFLPGALPSVFVQKVIKESGLEAALMKGTEEDHERLENIRELATLATRYDHLTGEEGVSLLLADAALASDQDELDRGQQGVTLMTVHASKGLEFDMVCITGLEEGLFPHEGMGQEERDEEEERRLFYVAVTRAKKKLILSLARVRRIYGTDYLQEPSSFLSDIDSSLLVYAEEDPYAGFIIEA